MKSKVVIFFLAISLITLVISTKAIAANNNLGGKILLQVESKGEAWYINPKDGKRYYMANGEQAFQIMKNLGVGASNKDIERMKIDASYRKQLIGKILLQVESKGEAYYISSDGNYNYLKDGSSAFNLMRKMGLGISNSDLNKISEYKVNTENKNPVSLTPVTGSIASSTLTYTEMFVLAVKACKGRNAFDSLDPSDGKSCFVEFAKDNGYQNPCDIFKNYSLKLEKRCLASYGKQYDTSSADRDGITIYDVELIRYSIGMYYNDHGKFPDSLILNNDNGGLASYIDGYQINKMPTAKKGLTKNCSVDYEYKYKLVNKNEYTLSYCIDGENAISSANNLTPGIHTATEKSIQ